jgi:hypothetical protein
MNNPETARYQMLAIRNRAASEARIRAAQTSRAASSPDGETKMDLAFARFPAGGGFIRLRNFTGMGLDTEKGLGFPKPFCSTKARELT